MINSMHALLKVESKEEIDKLFNDIQMTEESATGK